MADVNNALLELLEEYEDNATEKTKKRSKKGKPITSNPFPPDDDDISVVKQKIRECVPDDVEDADASSFFDDFDKNLDVSIPEPEPKTESKKMESFLSDKPKKKRRLDIGQIPSTTKSREHADTEPTPKPKEKKPKSTFDFDAFMREAEQFNREKKDRESGISSVSLDEPKTRTKQSKVRPSEQKSERSEENENDSHIKETTIGDSLPSKPKTKKPQREETIEDAYTLMRATGTSYPEEWLEYHEKAMRSKKSNIYQDKLKRGKFRINESHHIEWLPEHETRGKTVDEMLREKWAGTTHYTKRREDA